jgi:hypothetical protein
MLKIFKKSSCLLKWQAGFLLFLILVPWQQIIAADPIRIITTNDIHTNLKHKVVVELEILKKHLGVLAFYPASTNKSMRR